MPTDSGHHVSHAQAFEHGAHRAAGDDPGRPGADRTLTLPAPKRPLPSWCRCGPQRTRTIFLARQSPRDGFRHFAGLAVAEAHAALCCHRPRPAQQPKRLPPSRSRDAVDVGRAFRSVLATFLIAAPAAPIVTATIGQWPPRSPRFRHGHGHGGSRSPPRRLRSWWLRFATGFIVRTPARLRAASASALTRPWNSGSRRDRTRRWSRQPSGGSPAPCQLRQRRPRYRDRWPSPLDQREEAAASVLPAASSTMIWARWATRTVQLTDAGRPPARALSAVRTRRRRRSKQRELGHYFFPSLRKMNSPG